MLAKAKEHAKSAQAEQLRTVLAKQNVGLLIAERMINLPGEVVPALHSGF